VAVLGVGAWFAFAPASRKSDVASGSDETDQAAAVSSTVRGSALATGSGKPAPQGMIAVDGGSYSLGCGEGAVPTCPEDARPVHAVKVAPFAIMEHEVTMEEYDLCVAASACPPAGKKPGCTWQKGGKEKHPINCVSWDAAKAYCVHQGWRLPTEAEWEVAARGRAGTFYPWGNEAPNAELTVLAGAGEPEPVGSRPRDKSWVGAMDLGGNVREWTATDYAPYPGGQVAPGRNGKVNRGGSCVMEVANFSASYARDVDAPDASRPDLGFRCAADR